MTNKLVLRNIRKNIKDYGIYFFTLVFSICVFYMFNSIDAQKEIINITNSTSDSMKLLTKVLGYISIFISIILGFLIIYANRYFIKRRKKEIAVYEILGMEKKQVSFILVSEIIIIGIVALFVGSILGVFLSQFMSIFTAKIFETDMSAYKFVFSQSALIKSVLYFGVIFCIVSIFNLSSMYKNKLIDNIRGNVENENLKFNPIFSTVVFFISLACLTVSYYFLVTGDILELNKHLIISIPLLFIGTLLFFYSFAGLAIKVVRRNKGIYYKGLNTFVTRQINSKIKTNFLSISMICVMLFLTITILSSGLAVEKVMSNDLRSQIGYDASFYNFRPQVENSSVKDNLPQELKDKKYVKDIVEFNVCYTSDIRNGSTFGKSESIGFDHSHTLFMKLSEYNEIAKYNGKEEVMLSDKEYLLVSEDNKFKKYIDNILKDKIPININGSKLVPKKNVNTVLYNSPTHMIVVVNDKYTNYMKSKGNGVNINLTNYDKYSKEYERLVKSKLNLNYKPNSGKLYIGGTTKYKIYSGAIGVKALVSFLSIYIGLVFLMTSSVLLAIQQLSDVQDNKKRYDMLNKFGAERKMINKALFNQIGIYFIVPLVLAIIHATFSIITVNNIILEIGEVNMLSNLVITSLSIISIYGLYFLITYFQSKNVIMKD